MMEHSKKDLYDSIWKVKLESGGDALTNRIREAIKEVSSGFRCLDIGCGDGLFGSLIRDRYHRLYGIDGSKVALKDAVSRGIHTCLVDLDSGFLPFRDDIFDCISCLDVVEHIYDPERFIKEISRVLNRDGILILTTPNIRFIDFLKRILLNGQFPKTSQDHGSYDGGHIHFFTFKDIRDLLSANGFNILRERGYDRKDYSSPKVLLFKLIMRMWERDVKKEFFCPGILFKAKLG